LGEERGLIKTDTLDFGTLTAAGIETLAITTSDTGTVAAGNQYASIDVLDVTLADATTITVTGNNGLNMGTMAAAKVTTFDASGVQANNTTEDIAANLAVTFASGNTTAAANLTITGGEGNDTLTGNLNADTINGGSGNDILAGSTGADIINGGDGTDTYAMTSAQVAANIEGAGTGTSTGLAVNLGTAAITGAAVLAATGQNLTSGASLAANTVAYVYNGELTTNSAVVDTLTSIENVTLATAGIHFVMGSAAANVISTGAGADYIDGGAGADTINGGDGADKMFGGLGDDTIIVESTAHHDTGETIDGGAGTDTLSITGTTTLIAIDASIVNVENIAISGTSTVIATGQTEAFAITITDTATTLTTGSGNDTVTLTAGTLVNTIKPLLTSGSDTIVGFDAGEDKLDLDALGAVADATITAVNSVTHITAGAITDNAAYVISNGGLSLTAAGTEVITDYTDLADVAAYLAEGFTGTAALDEAQFVINDVAGDKTFVYHFLEAAGAASTISAAELTLVLTITEETLSPPCQYE
jgi:Ca2+-binding RTX toxin-like protein